MISIVIPTYNEKDNINNLVTRIDNALTGIDYEIVFVDDSTDETPEIIKKVAETNPHITLHHRENEKGLATAVVKGFKIASGDYIACMDADLQHPPEVLRDMYAAMLAHADMAIPSRFIPGGSDGGLDIIRKIISGTARYIGKLILPCLRHISDPTSGLFMIRRDILQGSDLNPIGWKIMVEVIAMCPVRKVLETPYTFHDREQGESKISAKVSWEYIVQLFNLRKTATNKGKGMIVARWSEKRLQEKLSALK